MVTADTTRTPDVGSIESEQQEVQNLPFQPQKEYDQCTRPLYMVAPNPSPPDRQFHAMNPGVRLT